LAVYGRAGGLEIYELLGMAGATETADWVEFYESGLTSYRAREFIKAIEAIEKALALRKQDQPSVRMIERCKKAFEAPSSDDWNDTAIVLTK